MKVYLDIADGKIMNVGTSPIGVNPVEVETDDWGVFDTPQYYQYLDGELIAMEGKELLEARESKDAELNQFCKNAILGGFTHNINGIDYHFSYDAEAQQNFTDAQTIISDGLVDSVTWTVRKNGVYERILVNKETMSELKIVILKHKTDCISRYRDYLMPMVNNAKTVEEINAINWFTNMV